MNAAKAARNATPRSRLRARGASTSPTGSRLHVVQTFPRGEWETLVSAQAQDATFVNLPGLLSTHCVKSGSSSYLAVDLTPTLTGKQPADIPGDIRSQGKILNDWGLHLVDVNLVMGNLQSLIRKQAASYAH